MARRKSQKSHIEAVTVNHNTSAYLELMLRSLRARHPAGLNLSLKIFDNASTDDRSTLMAYTQAERIPIISSGFTTHTENNSHGEVLRRFVLDYPDCTHYLFLDTDVCFLEDSTLHTMLDELESDPNLFGIGPRISWNGVAEISKKFRKNIPDIYDTRLHPCCALVKNTPLFRSIVDEIGLSCVQYLWAGSDEYMDTFKLMTKVMKTHGLKHAISSKMVLHFFCVSYKWEPAKDWDEMKARKRDKLLMEFRTCGDP